MYVIPCTRQNLALVHITLLAIPEPMRDYVSFVPCDNLRRGYCKYVTQSCGLAKPPYQQY